MLFHPSHPGEVLKDYLGDMTVKEAATRLSVTRPNLSRILNGRAGISAAMSVRLAKAMPYTSPEFWLKMQLNYDLWKARKNRLPKITPFPVRLTKNVATRSRGTIASSARA
jgi:antitoxin HigA-1